MGSQYALAVDVGGTKIAIALVDEELRITEKKTIPSHASNGSELWERIADATTQILQDTQGKLVGVGIGSAGPIDLSAGTISPVNIPIWRDFPIVEMFQQISKVERITLHGDAMALAHAEHKVGAGVGSRNMFGIVVSTGIGGGLVLDNKLFEGETGNTSYFGHSSIDFSGVQCACGRLGCVEAYASGPSMVAKAKQLGWRSEENSFIGLAEAARLGDSIAIAAIDGGTRALAVGLVNFVSSLDIAHIVIGGGVAQAGEVFWAPLMKHIHAETEFFNFLNNLKVSPAKLTTDAGLIGAALGVL